MKLRQLKLADLLQVQNGFAFKSELFCDTDRGLPLIRIRDLPNSSTEVQYDGPYREEFIVNHGDFLIGMDGDFRCFRWNGPRGLLNQRVCRLQGFVDGVEPDFIYHWIGSKLEAIHSTTAFVTVKHISSKQILNLDISLPPLDEQRRIVDILNHAASIRRLREEARAKAREIIPALFVDMFGDPATNPKGWVECHLGEMFEVKGGKRLPKGEAYSEVPTPYRYIRGTDISQNQICEASLVYLPEAVQSTIVRYVVESGDVVVTIAGKIGVAAPVQPSLAGVNLTENAAMLKAKDRTRVHPVFVSSMINSDYVQKQIDVLTGRVTIGKLALERAKTLRILLPPFDLQQEFAERVAEVEGISTLNDRAATAAEQMAQSLLAQVFGQAA